VKRPEDVKKLIYAGAAQALLNGGKPENIRFMEEVSKRFGKDKIGVTIADTNEYTDNRDIIEQYASRLVLLDNIEKEVAPMTELRVLLHVNHAGEEQVLDLLASGNITGISGGFVSQRNLDLTKVKVRAIERGIEMNILTSSIDWSEMKTDEKGLVPVIVQDYKNDEVLMLAYMNEMSFKKTLETGKMTYFSRSRQSLWVKGETSGHFQYVKELKIDCDNDTILAKVAQIGAACHTGNRSCFYRTLARTSYDDTNPLHVFQDVYDVIKDRKKHPKEGSYTNYLFDKGIDKILKKVGEENTEIIIAAKNPDSEEIKYEVSDYLYHLMVLMVERGVTWDDITAELARR
jgi:phosphoribosyl-ATP pyrophosphohydrolase/phosphoribosyl-AMP cyclohydrolase